MLVAVLSRQPDGKLALTSHANLVDKLVVSGCLALSTLLEGSVTKTEWEYAEVPQVAPMTCVWGMYTHI